MCVVALHAVSAPALGQIKANAAEPVIGPLVTMQADSQSDQPIGSPGPMGPPAPLRQARTPTGEKGPPTEASSELPARAKTQPDLQPALQADDALETRRLGATRSDSSASADGASSSAPTSESPTLVDISIWRTVTALGVVLAVAFGLKWVISRSLKGSGMLSAHLGPAGKAPSGVLTVLGRYPIARKQSLVLLKVDRRVLLLAHTESGFQTLSEMTDPEEVASILVATRDDEGVSISRRFSSMMHDLERDPALGDGALREMPMTPRRIAEARDGATAETVGKSADPVGSLRKRLATLREEEQ